MTESIPLPPEKRLEKIITDNLIYPVFQPIVSLRDGKLLGFEALSRISEKDLFDNVEDMFRCAELHEEIWRLEQVCRHAILASISEQKSFFDQNNLKLFINVNPKVLYDEKFQACFTKEYTKRYGIDVESITIEVTERQRIEDEQGFTEAVNHYKRQNYHIAIDDIGSGYSGLNRICSLSPNYIKLDMELIRDVHKSPTKLALIQGLVDFSVNSGILLIAEGIETKKELDVLINLGVQYGQGYYLGRPSSKLHDCDATAYDEILKKNNRNHNNHHLNAERNHIKNIASPGFTVPPDMKVEQVLTHLVKDNISNGICVLDGNRVIGTMTLEKLHKKLSGRYGFSLFGTKKVSELADTNFLQVEGCSSISNVARIAMERENESLYDFIVVNEHGNYLGIVTVQDLLQHAMKIN
ncbi:MAG: EAL domain-containing protein, partial [Butyrivibrio sp.]